MPARSHGYSNTPMDGPSIKHLQLQYCGTHDMPSSILSFGSLANPAESIDNSALRTRAKFDR